MEPKLIARLPTDELSKCQEFMDKFRSGNEVVIPDNIPLLIKDKNGYWHKLDAISEVSE